MARNKEKHVVGLNRLWLQTLDEENLKKNPPRPGLGSLKTASEVRKWIPSIKKDIDFCLKQSQVTCYPDSHIEDFSTRIDSLTREYKAYIRKLRELEPHTDCVPWTDRPYKRKHNTTVITDSDADSKDIEDNDHVESPRHKVSRTDFTALSTPVLDAEDSYTDLYGYSETGSAVEQNVDPDTQDLPLVFRNRSLMSIAPPDKVETVENDDDDDDVNDDKIIENIDSASDRVGNLRGDCEVREVNPAGNVKHSENSAAKVNTCTQKAIERTKIERNNPCKDKQVKVISECGFQNCDVLVSARKGRDSETKVGVNMKLYIPYSDSSSDEEENQV